MRLTKTGLGKRERKKTCPKTGIPHVLYVLISNDWAKPLPSLSLSLSKIKERHVYCFLLLLLLLLL